MSAPRFFHSDHGRRLAFHLSEGAGPTVVFCGGLQSDMSGTKAVFLEGWAKAAGRAFLRFDYSGHGQSSGGFDEGCLGDWAEDAFQMLARVVEGPVLLVGSSMGSWVSLLLARALPERIAGLVTIAAAPDFTEDSMWAALSEDQKATIVTAGRITVPSDYGAPLVITRRMIEDGRQNLVLRQPLSLPFPTRMLHGTADGDVDMSVSLRLLAHAEGPDIRLTLVRGADHRFSTPDLLDLIVATIEDVLQTAG